eukprot:SAG11_NODE_1182_length_5595_cov_1.928311_2_plen_67_part_00
MVLLVSISLLRFFLGQVVEYLAKEATGMASKLLELNQSDVNGIKHLERYGCDSICSLLQPLQHVAA